MTNKHLNVFLAEQGITQDQLSQMLGVTPATLCNYRKKGFPGWFQWALKGITAAESAGTVGKE